MYCCFVGRTNFHNFWKKKSQVFFCTIVVFFFVKGVFLYLTAQLSKGMNFKVKKKNTKKFSIGNDTFVLTYARRVLSVRRQCRRGNCQLSLLHVIQSLLYGPQTFLQTRRAQNSHLQLWPERQYRHQPPRPRGSVRQMRPIILQLRHSPENPLDLRLLSRRHRAPPSLALHSHLKQQFIFFFSNFLLFKLIFYDKKFLFFCYLVVQFPEKGQLVALHRRVAYKLDVGGVVAVPLAARQNSESTATHGAQNAAAVLQQHAISNVQHCPVLRVPTRKNLFIIIC